MRCTLWEVGHTIFLSRSSNPKALRFAVGFSVGSKPKLFCLIASFQVGTQSSLLSARFLSTRLVLSLHRRSSVHLWVPLERQCCVQWILTRTPQFLLWCVSSKVFLLHCQFAIGTTIDTFVAVLTLPLLYRFFRAVSDGTVVLRLCASVL